MQQAADQWLTTIHARALIEVPLDLMDGLKNRLREAYLAGFQDGRKKEGRTETAGSVRSTR